jgi:hypothetical protein
MNILCIFHKKKKNRFFYIKYVDQFSQILDNLIVQRFQSKKLENLRECDKEERRKDKCVDETLNSWCAQGNPMTGALLSFIYLSFCFII